MTKEEMVCEVTAFDEINKDETHGIYRNRSEANRTANELLKNYESQLNELEAEMENYRATKKEVTEKAKLAKERISKLKGEKPLDKKK
jgi:Arc/MetJ-type ribon-helix-helix transcriptional regulator